MPEYDFYCQDCKKDFTVWMSMSDYEANRGRHKCPGCGGDNVERTVSPVIVQTSRKS